MKPLRPFRLIRILWGPFGPMLCLLSGWKIVTGYLDRGPLPAAVVFGQHIWGVYFPW